MMSKKGRLIIVAGPSGTGKGTVEKAIMEKFPEIQFSVSVTTRPRRDYEIEGQHYFFISKAEFLKRIERNELVEWQEVYTKNGHYYGTLRSYVDSALEQGKQLLIDIDIKGGINLKKAYPDHSISIFIEPPSVDALEQRLIKRNTDSPEQIRIRLERMPEEMLLGKQFDYTIVNSDLKEAVNAFTEILEKEIYQQ
jgi:guanylate kinase